MSLILQIAILVLSIYLLSIGDSKDGRAGEAWEKNISTSKATIQGNSASVNVTLKGGPSFGNKKLKVGLRKEGGAWKIDSVNNRMNP